MYPCRTSPRKRSTSHIDSLWTRKSQQADIPGDIVPQCLSGKAKQRLVSLNCGSFATNAETYDVLWDPYLAMSIKRVVSEATSTLLVHKR
jgi:hypothetical protein